MKKSLSLFFLLAIGIIFLSNSYRINDSSNFNFKADCTFSAVEMPPKLGNDDQFPMDSNTVDNWVKNSFAINGLETHTKIISHSWGLWQALTEKTDQTCEGRQLRRFETWYTPQDVMIATMEKKTSMPKSLNHTGKLQVRRKFETTDGGFHGATLKPKAGDIVGKVKYNPAIAEDALKGKYFDTDVMKARIKPDKISTIQVPNNSVLLKPIYRVLTPNLRVYDGIYRFHVWSGKSDGMKDDKDFEKYVYVCTNPKDSRIDNKDIFSINTFIHHKMTQAEADEYNSIKNHEGEEYAGNKASKDDVIIFLGCHVSTREITRWTWQSFYWSPNPDNPVFPSSKTMANGRKTVKGLDQAANHYAVSLGYSMLSPAAPIDLNGWTDRRTNNRSSVYALNPYIEGTFTTDVFQYQKGLYNTSGLGNLFKPRNIDGITSSCMSCHSQATYIGDDINTGVSMFVANQYVPRDAPWFTGRLQTDFSWSLSGSFEAHPKKTKPNTSIKKKTSTKK